jgi:hypothetical protein
MPLVRTLTPILCSLLLLACTEEPVSPVSAEHQHHAPLLASSVNSASQNQINALIRRSTARYQRLEAALADGYVLASPCVPGMGYHYQKEKLLDGVVDPSQPEFLVYEPQKNGRKRLVAAEFMVPAEDWDPFNAGPPMLGERAFDDHRAPGSPGPPFPHYQLHAWVWMNNPDGIYAPLNPNASCRYANH